MTRIEDYSWRFADLNQSSREIEGTVMLISRMAIESSDYEQTWKDNNRSLGGTRYRLFMSQNQVVTARLLLKALRM